ncbi:MAG: DUF294 nucleotidyltransferase-like domain-containing protein [Armatimonadetes bacterium]|nr:DUF294 nucleotidyltransferase-like domain-containing protein [Armatimonadota bacterium]
METQTQEHVFDHITDRKELSAVLLKYRDSLAAQFSELGGQEMMLAYSDLTDTLVERIFQLALDEDSDTSVRRKAPRGIAIAAVGGYGRQEMSPYSDVDVAFLVGAGDDEEIDLVVKRAFRILMDVIESAGLSVGYSYRRMDEVQHLPLEVQTALLDARRIVGSATIFEKFQRTLRSAIAPAAFVVEHIRGRRSANSSGSTPYMVEPDIKEGHGGLRDFHAARWVARVAFGLSNSEVWYGLRSRGILLDSEMNALHEAAEFHCKVRNCLHLLAGRGLDILNIDRQEQVAQALNYDSASDFISQYFFHAENIWSMYRKVSGACLEADLEIEPGIVVRDGRLRILDRGLLLRDDTAIMRVFRHAQSLNLVIDRESRDLITETSASCKPTPGACRSFIETLSLSGTAAALRSMAEMGVLQVLIPQFDDLMRLVPGDNAHKFTVGEHSLRAVEELEILLGDTNEQFIDAAARIHHFEVMFLATLLHDIGKLDTGCDHAQTGAIRVSKIAAKLGMPGELCAKVEFLVSHHLNMAETARLRDLHRNRTITDFVAMVPDPDLLDMLFLLTIADSRAVGTSNWGRVQTRFLLELHERSRAALRSPSSALMDVERHKNRVRRELCLANLPPEEVDEHCASMPASYLLNTPSEDLAAHIGYVRTVRGGAPAIDTKEDIGGDFTELTVVAKDKTGLLNEIAGVLHAMSINVHAAQIYTRHSTDDIAIDLLFIDFDGRQLTEVNKWELEGQLSSVLSGSVSVEELLARWGRHRIESPRVIDLKAMGNISDHETVLEVRAEDTTGLLYYLTSQIAQQGMSIHSARVATWGGQAQDAFYVTTESGAKLKSAQVTKLSKAISAN